MPSTSGHRSCLAIVWLGTASILAVYEQRAFAQPPAVPVQPVVEIPREPLSAFGVVWQADAVQDPFTLERLAQNMFPILSFSRDEFLRGVAHVARCGAPPHNLPDGKGVCPQVGTIPPALPTVYYGVRDVYLRPNCPRRNSSLPNSLKQTSDATARPSNADVDDVLLDRLARDLNPSPTSLRACLVGFTTRFFFYYALDASHPHDVESLEITAVMTDECAKSVTNCRLVVTRIAGAAHGNGWYTNEVRSRPASYAEFDPFKERPVADQPSSRVGKDLKDSYEPDEVNVVPPVVFVASPATLPIAAPVVRTISTRGESLTLCSNPCLLVTCPRPCRNFVTSLPVRTQPGHWARLSAPSRPSSPAAAIVPSPTRRTLVGPTEWLPKSSF
jgi:hypothetical protein